MLFNLPLKKFGIPLHFNEKLVFKIKNKQDWKGKGYLLSSYGFNLQQKRKVRNKMKLTKRKTLGSWKVQKKVQNDSLVASCILYFVLN